MKSKRLVEIFTDKTDINNYIPYYNYGDDKLLSITPNQNNYYGIQSVVLYGTPMGLHLVVDCICKRPTYSSILWDDKLELQIEEESQHSIQDEDRIDIAKICIYFEPLKIWLGNKHNYTYSGTDKYELEVIITSEQYMRSIYDLIDEDI